MWVYMCICKSVYMCTCIYLYSYVCACVHMSVHSCMCILFLYMFVCLWTYVHMFFDKRIKDINPFRRVKMIPICFSPVSEVRSYFHLIRLSKGSKISFVSHPACWFQHFPSFSFLATSWNLDCLYYLYRSTWVGLFSSCILKCNIFGVGGPECGQHLPSLEKGQHASFQYIINSSCWYPVLRWAHPSLLLESLRCHHLFLQEVFYNLHKQ